MTREDRWEIRRARGATFWYAQPLRSRDDTSTDVWADLGQGQRAKRFATWREAIAYVMRRVYGR